MSKTKESQVLRTKTEQKQDAYLPNVWRCNKVGNVSCLPEEVAQILSYLPQNGMSPVFLFLNIKTIGNISNSNVEAVSVESDGFQYTNGKNNHQIGGNYETA